MRFSILTFSFLFVAQWAMAQYYPIRLADNDPALEIPTSFSIVDVVDFRKDTLSVGFIELGSIATRLRVANLQGGAASSIKQYIRGVMPPQLPGTESVAMVIKELRIYEEVVSARDLARLHVNYEFYRIKGTEVSLALSFQRDYDSHGRNVTKRHEGNVRQSIREALSELASSNKHAAKSSMSNGGVTDTYAVLTSAKPVRGIYRSLEEFRDNAPSIQRDFELCQKSKLARICLGAARNELYYKEEDGTHIGIEEPIWGFCDGEKIYIRRANGYVELARDRNTCTFHAYTTRSRKSSGLVGGLIGNPPQLARYQLDVKNGLAYQIN